MRCIIIEDQPPAQRILKKYIEDVGTLELKGVFSDATQVPEFLRDNPVDLIFLVVHLPKLSGMEFLNSLPDSPNVILTTAFSDYALESYEFKVIDYLLKPFSFQRFVQAVNKAASIAQNSASDQPRDIFIKSGYEYVKVSLDDIHYIKSDADYTELYLPGKKLLSSESLKFWVDFLDDNQFIRIHKSFIVNTAKIEKVGGKYVYLQSGEELPIGRAYKEEFSNRFFK
jgi:DNA-binding LytR/AlgR family response regulator